ncbi:P-loop containing nucleoside triphosphate hydrolase protein [Microdochium bolleyi]|uniref:ATP-dependent RNA helicase ROK1 n=1 Tax=Microdochium bolleyi TaxID=196109 RepID=A0A136JG30_9PEZI|nr:P-loop containing nucleoside triphosphate hydrolase protein [Microdochium bolleyi]
MDILKILSRGTKKSAPQNVPAATKPTTKKVANPQLYNDPTRGTKRKRTEQPLPEQQTASDAEEDVDFFAPKDLNKVSSHDASAARDQDTAKAQKQDAAAPAPLDDDEVRQILRSHRLKFTLLSAHEDERAAKVKKSKKKQKTAPPPTNSSKDSKRSLYPQPLTSFTELRSTYNVSSRVCSNLAQQGFRLPTEVQLASLPLLLNPSRALASSGEDLDYSNGIDFLAVAPTGSGKTLTFLIPSINDVLRSRAEGTAPESGPTAIIIAPTRELAHQIANEGKKLAQGTGVKIVGMKKGMAIQAEGSAGVEEVQAGAADEENADDEDKSDSEDGSDAEQASDEDEQQEKKKKSKQQTITKADILVTTPMMLLNFLNKGSRTLPSVRSLILDEADVLLDPLFRDQTMGIWNACSSRSLRATLWSATMGANIESLVAEQLKPRTSAPLVRLVVGLKDTAVPSIRHKLIYTATEQGKLFALRQLLHPNQSSSSSSTKPSASSVPEMRLPFLIFAQTIDRATALHNELQYDIPVEAGGSARIAALHSAMSEPARAAVISRFRRGEIWVLVTTDLLMRGIDFHGVNGVINYDVPTSAAAYVHRVGRTGRAGNRDGCVAVTLYTTEDVAHLKTIANVIAMSEKQAASGSTKEQQQQQMGTPEETAVPKWLMDALPKVGKDSKKKLKERGVESRRSLHGSGSNKTGDQKQQQQKPGAARITSKSAWERRKEHNKRGAIEGSKNRKRAAEAEEASAGGGGGDNGDEWGGLDD